MTTDKTLLYLTKDLRRAIIIAPGEANLTLADPVKRWLSGEVSVLAVGDRVEVVFLDA